MAVALGGRFLLHFLYSTILETIDDDGQKSRDCIGIENGALHLQAKDGLRLMLACYMLIWRRREVESVDMFVGEMTALSDG
jgi:hypothetical protein